MSWFRVLAIPAGKRVDAAGREVGDDWLLLSLGEDDDGTGYHVTTDCVRASGVCDLETDVSAGALARDIAAWLNKREADARQLRLL